ncbi:MAG: hypothetical protein ACTHL8_08875 [Burkholderiaceae bacterium]
MAVLIAASCGQSCAVVPAKTPDAGVASFERGGAVGRAAAGFERRAWMLRGGLICLSMKDGPFGKPPARRRHRRCSARA